jgi:hypothetical protein
MLAQTGYFAAAGTTEINPKLRDERAKLARLSISEMILYR